MGQTESKEPSGEALPTADEVKAPQDDSRAKEQREATKKRHPETPGEVTVGGHKTPDSHDPKHGKEHRDSRSSTKGFEPNDAKDVQNPKAAPEKDSKDPKHPKDRDQERRQELEKAKDPKNQKKGAKDPPRSARPTDQWEASEEPKKDSTAGACQVQCSFMNGQWMCEQRGAILDMELELELQFQYCWLDWHSPQGSDA